MPTFDPIQYGPIEDHVTAVNRRLEEMEARLHADRESLAERLLRLQKEQMLGGEKVDDADLRAFLAKPYIIRPLGGDKYELIVPKFIGLRGGWPLRAEGAFSIYLVSRFIHLINPLPDWLVKDLGYQASPYHAILEGNTLVVDRGDPRAVAAKLGRGVAKVEGNRLSLRPSSRFDIIRKIIREDGILPYAPAPIPPELRRDPGKYIARDDNGQPAFTLRPHQQRDYDRFLELGAVAYFAYGQTGKSYEFLQACAGLKGRKILFVPTRALRDQWLLRLQMLAPEAQHEVTIATYQSLDKYRDTEWTLGAFDEAHHLPANLFIEAATLRMVARMGLSATPVREDQNEDLIPALCGFPLGADWPISETQRPRVYAWIVKDEAAKLSRCEQLVSKEIEGKTLIFTWRLDIGTRAAKRLGVPFVHGGTKKPIDVIGENDTVVISKVGDAGLSFPVDRIVEIDFQYGSRQEAGQRLLRAAYDTGRRAEYHVLMTRHEFENYGKRLLIYEQWGLDVQVIDEGAPSARMPRAASFPRKTTPRRTPPSIRERDADVPVAPEPQDDIARTLALAPVAAKVRAAKEKMERAHYAEIVLRACWAAMLSPEDIALGLGSSSSKTTSRIRLASRALKAQGLLKENEAGQYGMDQDEIKRLTALAGLSGLARRR